jgi:Ca-activated chloride channel homolog
MNGIPVEAPDAAARQAGLVTVDGRIYPLESVRLAARAEGGVASSRLVQRFANPHDEALEVTYTLPLPADGAVLGYTIRVGGRVIRAEVEPRAKAEADYRRALCEGRTAGLLEQDRADTFQQRLGNIPPRTPVEVEIDVLQPLAFLAGGAPRWEYRFPTVAGVRYEGAPGRVPDAERLDPDRGAPETIPARMEFELRVADARGPIESVGHDLTSAAEVAPGCLRLAGQKLDRDVVARWEACAPEVGARVTEGRGLPGDDGRYALVTITPPAAPRAALARDLTVLIDASGSMSGWPLEVAKHVVRELLMGLEPCDRFELIAFATRVQPLTPGLLRGDAAGVAEALAALDGLAASGATEMHHAIEHALAPLREGSQRQVVLVTDGEIGFEQQVIGHVRAHLPAGTRVHVVGIGSAPNRTLTRGLARAGRGVELIASRPERQGGIGLRLRAATAMPVLTDVRIGGSAVVAVAPERPRDVFAGQPALVTIELRKEGGTLEIRGTLSGDGEPWTQRIDVPPVVVGEGETRALSLPLGALFGREAIEDLEMELAAAGREAGIEERIEAVALRHHIVSRCTSLVAIAEEPSLDPRLPSRRERLAVELPAGVSAEGVGMAGFGMLRGATMNRLCAEMNPSPSAFEAARSDGFALEHLACQLADQAPVQPRLVEPMHVVREKEGVLVLVFEVPGSGLELSERVMVLLGEDGVEAEVVPEASSAITSHAPGKIVRLAVRRADGREWPAHEHMVIIWFTLREAFKLRFDLARAEEGGSR